MCGELLTMIHFNIKLNFATIYDLYMKTDHNFLTGIGFLIKKVDHLRKVGVK